MPRPGILTLRNFCGQRFTSKSSPLSFHPIVHPHSFQQHSWHHPGCQAFSAHSHCCHFPPEGFPDNSNLRGEVATKKSHQPCVLA